MPNSPGQPCCPVGPDNVAHSDLATLVPGKTVPSCVNLERRIGAELAGRVDSGQYYAELRQPNVPNFSRQECCPPRLGKIAWSDLASLVPGKPVTSYVNLARRIEAELAVQVDSGLNCAELRQANLPNSPGQVCCRVRPGNVAHPDLATLVPG